MPILQKSTRKNKFPKSERLCSLKAIETLFAGGTKSLTAFPLRVVFRHLDSATPSPATSTDASSATSQVLISVSKRRFKHAVDRNRTKRQIREAWRLNRDILSDTSAKHLAFIWIADELQPSALINRKMKNLLHRINEQAATLTP